MPKCREWPETTRALNKYLSSGFPGANVNAMWSEIDLEPDRYGGRVSRNTIENFRKTGLAMAKTEQVVRKFLTVFAGFEPETPMRPIVLNVGEFFGMNGEKRNRMVVGLAGRYQTYARSTARPGKIRRGSLEFLYDTRHRVVRIKERQHLPADETDPTSVTIDWEGYAAQRERRIFCVMRTTLDRGQATPLFQIMNIAEENPSNSRITALVSYSMGVEEIGREYIAFPTVLLRRLYDDAEAKTDLIDEDEFARIARGDAFLSANIKSLIP